ncbi:MAG: CoA-binding protein [Vulcanimicrobiaceae bacterium]
MILDTAAQLRALLETAHTIAVVGASANESRPSYTVFRYLLAKGRYDVTPINPTIAQIDGVKAFPSLTAYAAQRGAPDIVDVFRKPSEVVEVVKEAIAAGAKAIWFQYGVINGDAIRLADEAGLAVVVDRCLKVESARLDGGLSTDVNARFL